MRRNMKSAFGTVLPGCPDCPNRPGLKVAAQDVEGRGLDALYCLECGGQWQVEYGVETWFKLRPSQYYPIPEIKPYVPEVSLEATHTSVELRSVYEWTCDACGQDNLARPRMVEYTDAEYEARASEQHVTVDELKDHQIYELPVEVVCRHCGAKYAGSHNL